MSARPLVFYTSGKAHATILLREIGKLNGTTALKVVPQKVKATMNKKKYGSMKNKLLAMALLGALTRVCAQNTHGKTDTLSLKDRITITTQAFSALNHYFAHYADVPAVRPDSVYAAYLDDFIHTPDRFEFSLLMKAFMGAFRNGHTWYRDKWLSRHYNQPLGFTFRYLAGKWVVLTSQVPGLTAGSILSRIDTTDFESFFQSRRKYLNAGSERAERVVFAGDRDRYVFPLVFTVETTGGKKFLIDRREHHSEEEKLTEGRWLVIDRVAYIRAKHLNFNEEELIHHLQEYKGAPALIIDIRGYSGGTTPAGLVDRLMDRPYRYFSEGTSLNMGLFQFYGRLAEMFKGQLDTASHILYSGMKSYFERASITWPAAYIQPTQTLYRGKLLILVDGGVVSAKEDFLLPFKDNGRTLIIGEPTMGSTGQPFFYNLNADIQVAVGTKRAYFPDGSTFENVGIRPDIEVVPTIEDIRKGRDAVLQKALELVRSF